MNGYIEIVLCFGRMRDLQLDPLCDRAAELNRRLTDLAVRLKGRPEVTVEYFVPDKRKAGGAYVSVTGVVQNISAAERVLFMEDGTEISMDEIVSLRKL